MRTRASNPSSHFAELSALRSARALAEQAFSRAAGAPLLGGNSVRLLIDAAQNYPAWLAAIASDRDHVHFESYIIHEDSAGQEFANALIAKAQEGVPVRLIYDWMGGFGKTSHKFWNSLRAGGVGSLSPALLSPTRIFAPPFDVQEEAPVDSSIAGPSAEVSFLGGLC